MSNVKLITHITNWSRTGIWHTWALLFSCVMFNKHTYRKVITFCHLMIISVCNAICLKNCEAYWVFNPVVKDNQEVLVAPRFYSSEIWNSNVLAHISTHFWQVSLYWTGLEPNSEVFFRPSSALILWYCGEDLHFTLFYLSNFVFATSHYFRLIVKHASILDLSWFFFQNLCRMRVLWSQTLFDGITWTV